jgi:hypothetical protein
MFEVGADIASGLEGRLDSGYFRVWLAGATVNHLEGWKSPLH